jgi:glutamate synthase (NADPH/NADH) small chain
MQFGIPQFRLPKTILSRYVKVMKALDIRFRPNAIIGAVIRIEDLFRDGYSSVFIGTGTWKAKNLGIRGETLGNVHFGIDYLATNDAYDLGKNVAVIGMGNVAMDVARTALRRGAEKVTLFSRDQGMTASPHEVAYAELDGAEFVFGKSIDSITDEGPVFRTTLFDENGQVTGVSDETELFPADSTVISISQGPRRKLIRTTAGLEGDERGLLRVDEEHMTTLKGVFAAGDVVTGPRSVVEAVDGAKKAAAAMMRYMEGEDS